MLVAQGSASTVKDQRKGQWHSITIERQNGTVEIVQPIKPRPLNASPAVVRHNEFESFQGSEDQYDIASEQWLDNEQNPNHRLGSIEVNGSIMSRTQDNEESTEQE